MTRTTNAVVFAAVLIVGCNPADARSSPTTLNAPVTATPIPSTSTLRTASCDPSADASPTDFSHGTATVHIATGDQEQVTLDQIGNTSFYARFDPSCPFPGAQAEWTNSPGAWLLTVLASTSPNDAWSGQQASLTIERYAGEPPLYADGSPCTITVTEVSASGLAGMAECHGLRWLNDYQAQTDPEAAPLASVPPFDVSITFDARP